jgi:isocitrate dehydrogenase (NAD+)
VTRVSLIRGDGIGPEVADAAVRVLDAAGAGIEWSPVEAGYSTWEAGGDPLPEASIAAIRETGLALKGPLMTPVGHGFSSANVAIRRKLDLYANLRPVRNLRGINSRYEGIDMIVIRENTEGLYSGIEHFVTKGTAVSLKVVTEEASSRISRFAFDLAKREGRKRVTAVHKANIMKLSDGLFLDCARREAERPENASISFDDVIVDAMSMHLVMHPERYDVLLMGNLYGDILSDLAAGLVGGLGLTPSGNIGDDAAVFEAVHGTAPDIAGQGMANPAALIRAGVMLLRHIGQSDSAARVETAVEETIASGTCTGDLGGKANTLEFADAVIVEMGA